MLRVGEHHQCGGAEQKCLALIRVVVVVLVRPRHERIPEMGIRLREGILKRWPVIMNGFMQAVGEARDKDKGKGKIKIPHGHKGASMRNAGKGRGANDSYPKFPLNAERRIRIS